jgi:hypothetical protein
MDAELKQKWVTALRSGEYKQGRRALKTIHGTHCCLGVLADVIDPNGWEGRGWKDNTVWLSYNIDTIDLSDVDQDTLMGMNDCPDDPKSFSEIADYIEANL